MVGGQTIRTVKPTNPIEMANCNSAMRLMASEKGGETPTERIVRMKSDISQWYEEMNNWGLTREEQKILEPYYLPNNATPAQQEELMTILMDKDICHFTLAEANQARKIVAKKQMDKIPELHQKILDQAASPKLGAYVYETAIKPQLGYSFSKIHSLAYSFIGLQTLYLATYFPSVYWNTACLRVDSGLDEEAASNYAKIAKAVGGIIHRSIELSLIDVNKSQYGFEPDEENNRIIYGMKALNGVGGEIIQEIIANRPYSGLEDFQEKVKCNKTVMISLIKSGAFDQFGERKDIMRQYIMSVCEPKKRITLQNFNGLIEHNMIPAELAFQKRLFVFNKALKNNCAIDGMYVLKADNYYKFYEEFFDIDLLEPYGNKLAINQDVWKKKIYTKQMKPASDYLKAHQEELLEAYNKCLFQEQWDKYAAGNYSNWEMASLGMYYHPHELANADLKRYDIVDFGDLPKEPVVTNVFKRNGVEIPIFELNRIAGTVIAKDEPHSSFSLLTVNDGVVTVKVSRDYFARINRRISEIQEDGKKKVMENGWLQKSIMLVVQGIRRGDMFICKKYKKSKYHQVCKILSINERDGSIETTHLRYGEVEDE